MKRTRLIRDHADDPDVGDYHEWVLLGEKIRADAHERWGGPHEEDYPGRQRLDTLGRPHNGGWTRWLTLRCNNGECPAIAIVNESWLIEEAAADLPPLPEREVPRGSEGSET